MVLRIAVVGVGAMGRHHARILSTMKEVRLVAVCDANLARANEIAAERGCAAFDSVGAMLGSGTLDAATVAVPTSAHLKTAADLLRAGLDVLVEKPIAATEAEGARLIEEAKAHGRLLAVGHIERFNPAVRRLKQIVDAGGLGTPQSLVARRVGLPPTGAKDVDVVFDLAVHDFDVISHLLGRRASRVWATGGSSSPDGKIDHAEVLLDFAGAGAFVQVNWLTPAKLRTLSVTGSEATAELNYVSQELRVARRSGVGAHSSFGEFVNQHGTPSFEPETVEVREPLEVELSGFAAAARGEGRDYVDGGGGLEAVRLASEAVRQIHVKA